MASRSAPCAKRSASREAATMPGSGAHPRHQQGRRAARGEGHRAHRRNRGIYGSPRIHRELRAQGVRVGKKRVERLMRDNGLKGRQKKQFCCSTDSRHSLPIAPNVLDRNFNPPGPNRAWAGDVTYIGTEEGWLYLVSAATSVKEALPKQIREPHIRQGRLRALLVIECDWIRSLGHAAIRQRKRG